MSPQCTCAPRPIFQERAAEPEERDPLSIEHQESYGKPDAPTRAAQIVVAEDDAEMRELLVLALEQDGHEIVEARNGDELFARLDSFWARGREPDLVISDIRMPGCSGLSVLAHMNDDERSAPVILITGFGDYELHEQATLLGAAAVLDKPFDVDELRLLARRILRSVRP